MIVICHPQYLQRSILQRLQSGSVNNNHINETTGEQLLDIIRAMSVQIFGETNLVGVRGKYRCDTMKYVVELVLSFEFYKRKSQHKSKHV